MVDSDNRILTDSAHAYMECSNRGICDRVAGECICANGYEGAACQRAGCPGFPLVCSGHGVCKTIQQLADQDHGNTYELWDKSSTMGCDCDAGFHGADCSKVHKFELPIFHICFIVMNIISYRDVVSMMLILSIWTTRKLCHMQFSTLRFFIRICLEKMLPTQIYQVHTCRSPMVCIPWRGKMGNQIF